MGRAKLLSIAREGWPFIGLMVAGWLYIHAYYGTYAALPFAFAALYLIAFFHDPERHVPAEPLAVIAPVDGRIVHRRECYDAFLDREAIKVSIHVSRMGAYLIRSVCEGTVVELPSDAWPEFRGTASWIKTDEGEDIVLAVPEGTMFGSRPCQIPYGERIGQGRRCGMRRLARRIDVYLPPNCRVEVEMGQRVRAGRDVLATLMRKTGGNGNGT